MKFREFLRTLRDSFLFLVMLAGVLLGFMVAYVLIEAASFRHLWTWILPVIGLAIFDGIVFFFYKEKPIFGAIRGIRKKTGNNGSA